MRSCFLSLRRRSVAPPIAISSLVDKNGIASFSCRANRDGYSRCVIRAQNNDWNYSTKYVKHFRFLSNPPIFQIQTRLFQNYTTDASETANDPYHKYRTFHPDNTTHFPLFNQERHHCHIEMEKLHASNGGLDLLRKKLSHQIQAGIPSPCKVYELGPSGKYEYTNSETQYLRRNTQQDKHQIVLEYSSKLLGPMSLSLDEDYIAYLQLDENNVQLVVRHIPSSHEIIMPFFQSPLQAPNSIANVEFGLGSFHQGYSFYFTTYNSTHRPDSVYICHFHPIQKTFSSLECIYQDINESHFVDIRRSKGGRFMILESTAKTSNEVFISDMEKEYPTPQCVMQREEGLSYFVDCGRLNHEIYILAHHMNLCNTTKKWKQQIGMELGLYRTNLENLPATTDIIYPITVPTNKESILEDMDIFEDYIVLYERIRPFGTQQIRIYSKLQNSSYIIDLPKEQVGSIPALSPGGNMCYHSKSISFSVSNLLTPPISYECNLKTGALRMSDTTNLDHQNHTQQSYQERLLIPSKDGTMIPMSLTYSKDQPPINRPTLLIGYGAYGISQNGQYDPTLLPLLVQGWIIAIAHTRGGGELGKEWYHKGRYEHKEACVEDFVACAKHLYGTEKVSQIIARGISAGGVMVTSAMLTSPELFQGIILRSPFLDVLGTMLNKDLPLTEHEFGEWGDPACNKRIRTSMERYCPTLNIKKMTNRNKIPDMLLIGAADDINVPVWNPVCFAMTARDILQKIREDKDPQNLILLHVEETGGHHMQDSWLEISTLELAFMMGVVSKNER